MQTDFIVVPKRKQIIIKEIPTGEYGQGYLIVVNTKKGSAWLKKIQQTAPF